MGHIFISYSRSDKKEVDRIVQKLEKAGHDVWLDREDIKGGDQWRESIVKAIKKGHALIVVISPHAVKSNNVRKELDLAEGASVRIIPVKLKAVDIPDEMQYQLAGIQQIDLSEDNKAGFKQLLSVIGIEKEAVPPWYRRGLAKLVLWMVGGVILGLMASSRLGRLGLTLPISMIIGALLGLSAGIGVFKLFGWITKVVGWVSVVIVGAVSGISVWPQNEIIAALVGAILGVVVVLMIRRWRRSRKQSKLAALAS